MSKCRFTSLDVKCIVRDLRSKLVGLRLANVYDCNNKTYLFKFATSSTKAFVVFESGLCVYSTKFPREHRESPSVFTLKFRKAIRAKILRNVEQVGFDRVIDFTFGSEEHAHHLVCEFYAGGNIILTDSGYKILLLLRPYQLESENRICAVGESYSVTSKQQLSVPNVECVNNLVIETSASQPSMTLSRCLSRVFTIGVDAVEHCLVEVGLSGRVKVRDYNQEKTPELIARFLAMATEIEDDSKPRPGYAVLGAPGAKSTDFESSSLLQSNSNAVNENGAAAVVKKVQSDLLNNKEVSKEGDVAVASYLKYLPFRFRQFPATSLVEFEDFDAAVDAYFSRLEGLQAERRKHEVERVRVQRLEKVRDDNEKRIQELQSQVDECKKKAGLLEENVDAVDKIIRIINDYFAKGAFWASIDALVKQEQRRGDPLATMIHQLRLEKKVVVLSLGGNAIKQDSENGVETTHKDDREMTHDHISTALVDIDLSLTAHGNITAYYATMRKAAERRQRTINVQNAALKSAMQKINADRKQVQVRSRILNLRKPYWFEKFKWFISSDNFVVVAGRDMLQNEILYKRHLMRGDIYVHADVHGASTCVIKNPTGGKVPPRTLKEVGTMCVCHSSAWKDKSVASAWWVHENQVSKTAPSGEYLTTGAFMVRGKKNFLLPSELVMGFGVLFRLADESIPSHVQQESGDVDSSVSEAVEVQDEEGEEKEEKLMEEEENLVEEEENLDREVDHLGAGGGGLVESYAVVDFAQEDEEVALLEAEESLSAVNLESVAPDLPSTKRRISAHERKQLKRQRQGKVVVVPPMPREQPKTVEKKEAPKVMRKSKLKKIKKKYRHQDEEERLITMRLLASAGKSKSSSEGSSSEVVGNGDEEDYKAQRAEALARASAAKREREIEEEEVRRLYKEEKLDQLSEKDLEKIQENYTKGLGVNLSALTGRPKPDDVLLYAMVVCAPYDVLSDYKYRIKLVPDSIQRRGKRSKLAIELFLKSEGATKKEKELISAIPESEIGLVMMSHAKLQMPGISQLLKKKKKAKRS